MDQLPPDPLRDSTKRRKRRARQRAPLLERLTTATQGAPLTLLVVPLGPCPGPALYALETNHAARARAQELADGAPAWVVLERGAEGGLHLNMVMRTADLPPELPPGAHPEPVTHLPGLVKYLSKPSDARAARWKDPRTGYRYVPSPHAIELAAQDLNAARTANWAAGRRKLPRMSWDLNLPNPSRINALRVSKQQICWDRAHAAFVASGMDALFGMNEFQPRPG